MKVFVSWSGSLSQGVASILRENLPSIIQDLKVFVSKHDIESGARWALRVAEELEDTDYGILCLSRESLHSDWLLYEAGALTKKMEGRACGLLIGGLKKTDVTGPLAQFQNRVFQRDEVRALLVNINDKLESPLERKTLDKSFEKYWADIEAEYEEVLKTSSSEESVQPKRDPVELIEEVLTIVRTIARETASESSSGRRKKLKFTIMKAFYSVLSAEERRLLVTLASCTMRGYGDKAIEETRKQPEAVSKLRATGLIEIDEDGQVIVPFAYEIVYYL